MKSLETIGSKTTIKLNVLTGITLIYLGLTNQLVAQNLINNIRSPHPNLGNINNNINQFTLIDNGPNNNTSQPEKSINVAGIKKKASSPIKRTKIIPVIHNPNPKVIAKPINKQAAAHYNPKPVVKPKRQLPLPQKKSPVTTAIANKPILLAQQPINKPIVNEVNNVSNNQTQDVIVKNTVVAAQLVQSNNQLIVTSNEKKVYASSGSSVSSKKTKHHFYASKRKSINHFRYSANKKIAKLFARTKKNKIDPARCFAWS